MKSVKRTFFLNNLTWDLTLTANGDIRTIDDGLAAATSVANAIQLFTNDAYFNADRGIPHFVTDLRFNPTMSVVRNRYRQAAVGVRGVTDAVPNVYKKEHRILGDITITTDEDETVTVAV